MSKLCHDIQKKLNKNISKDIVCKEWRSSIVLEGIVDSWDRLYEAGTIAVNKNYKGVLNKLEVKNLFIPDIKKPILNDNYLENKSVDILIIGGGIIGSSIARELSKWNVSILLVDKEDDLAMHTSSRNDGMIHPGIAPKPGTKKAYYNVKGNDMYTKVTKELNVPFKRTGSLILFDKKFMRVTVPILKRRATLNGVKDVKFLNIKELKKREPYISKDIKGALLMPSAGVLSPYKMTIAYAENAVMNGAEISLNTIVLSMKKEKGKIIYVSTNRGKIFPKIVINAAGIFSDKIADMVDDQFFTIHPRKGEIALLDKKKGHLLNGIASKPTITITNSHTKGGGLVKTIEGNILVGPNAIEQPFREDYTTDRTSFNLMLKKQLSIIPKLSLSDVITYLSGTRAATYEEDFIIEKSEYVGNLIYAAGIQSPGLASAPAIAEEIEKITIQALRKVKDINENPIWNPMRQGIKELNLLSLEERNKIIKENPNYGNIICRCEEISKGEIIDAIKSPIPTKSIDGIKRRVRSGMGRCQGGFCLPLVTKIINEESNIDMLSITKKGNSSNILIKETKANDTREEGGEECENI